jgi:hypothetical protein
MLAVRCVGRTKPLHLTFLGFQRNQISSISAGPKVLFISFVFVFVFVVVCFRFHLVMLEGGHALELRSEIKLPDLLHHEGLHVLDSSFVDVGTV